jgi:hypothetical protein
VTRVMTSMLFEVSPVDPLTYGGVALLLMRRRSWRPTSLRAESGVSILRLQCVLNRTAVISYP